MGELEWIGAAGMLGIATTILLLFKRLQNRKIKKLLNNKEKETALRVSWETERYMADRIYGELFQEVAWDSEKEGIQIWKNISLKRAEQSSFYDIFSVDKDMVCFVIGEVTGSGLEMLFRLTQVKSIIRSQMQEKKSTKAVMETISYQLASGNKEAEIRVLLLNFNRRTNCIMYCNAGYTLPILQKKGNLFEMIAMEIGEPIRTGNVGHYWQEYQYLRQGDSVLLYSISIKEILEKNKEDVVGITLRETLEYENTKVPIANMGITIKRLTEEKNVVDRNTILILFSLD